MARLEPLGPLGVTRDLSLEAAKCFVWTSHLTLNGPVNKLSDGQLWKIVEDASYEKERGIERYKIPRRRRPIAMTILASGNEIILASCQKGGGSFIYSGIRSRVADQA
jgi:hypothetical protein